MQLTVDLLVEATVDWLGWVLVQVMAVGSQQEKATALEQELEVVLSVNCQHPERILTSTPRLHQVRRKCHRNSDRMSKKVTRLPTEQRVAALCPVELSLPLSR